jgi:hypothetical protein
MPVRGNGDAGLEARAHHPEAILDARLEQLELEALEERDEPQIALGAVQCTRRRDPRQGHLAHDAMLLV